MCAHVQYTYIFFSLFILAFAMIRTLMYALLFHHFHRAHTHNFHNKMYI